MIELRTLTENIYYNIYKRTLRASPFLLLYHIIVKVTI